MIIPYIILAASVFALVLGFLVYKNNYKGRINQSFFGFASVIAVWNLLNFLFQITQSVFLVKSTYVVAQVLPVTAIIWFYFFFFGSIKKVWQKVVLYTAVFLSFLMSLFIFSTSSIVSSRLAGQNEIPVGPYFPLYVVFLGLLIASLIIEMLLAYRRARGIRKQQIKFIFLGIILFAVVALTVSVILPLVGVISVSNLDAPSSLILLGFSTYAIIKHRLMDIKLVVARSIAYLILLATLAAVYAGSVTLFERILFPSESQIDWAQSAVRTVIAVVMVFLFQPLRKWITNATDKIFFKNQYNPEELLNQLSHTMSETIVLIEMLYKINDLFMKNIKVSRSAFVLFKEGNGLYTSQAIGYKGWPTIDVPEFLRMAKRGLLIYDELEENSIYKKMLKKFDASIMVPIKIEEKGNEKLVGIYLAGEKNSGDMFTQQDIQIFEIMAPEVAVGIENAKAYEEISRFNVTLREEVKRATQKLKDKNEELRELDKAKDEFISMASHQLRTPLTAIKGYLSMLLEGDAGEIKVSQYDFINEAYSAAGRMVGLINDLLNVSRMETGRFFLEPKEVDVLQIVNEEVKQLQNHAREKGIYLKIDAKGKIPHIWADETKIRQVIMNFIDNAIYYTTHGGVTVKLKKDKDEFVFEVVDTGIGVPKAQQAHLFEKFFRADNARQTRPDGTGLGIYLAKRVVTDHGGKITFESTEGKGSTFGFRFPLKVKVSTKMASSPAAPALTSAAATLDTRGPQLEPSLTAQPPIEAESNIQN